MPAAILAFSISPHGPKQRALQVLTMHCHGQVVSDALCGLWMNRETPLLATLAHHAQCVIPSVDMKVPDLEASDLRAAESHLQPYRQNCPIA